MRVLFGFVIIILFLGSFNVVSSSSVPCKNNIDVIKMYSIYTYYGDFIDTINTNANININTDGCRWYEFSQIGNNNNFYVQTENDVISHYTINNSGVNNIKKIVYPYSIGNIFAITDSYIYEYGEKSLIRSNNTIIKYNFSRYDLGNL